MLYLLIYEHLSKSDFGKSVRGENVWTKKCAVRIIIMIAKTQLRDSAMFAGDGLSLTATAIEDFLAPSKSEFISTRILHTAVRTMIVPAARESGHFESNQFFNFILTVSCHAFNSCIARHHPEAVKIRRSVLD